MKILWVGAKFNYGRPERGLSFERYNFYDTLIRMDAGSHTVLDFPFDERELQLGRAAMQEQLLELAGAENPDLLFTMLFQEELPPELWRKLKSACPRMHLVNWFADDHWRFEGFSRRYAAVFDACVTTDHEALPKYAKLGHPQVILSQWGCNHFLYKPTGLAPDRDITFVGQAHGDRKAVAGRIRARGLRVDCFGKGWEQGHIGQEEMISLFNRSRVNLNLTNSSNVFNAKALAQVFLGKGGRFGLRLKSPDEIQAQVRRLLAPVRDQIKGRTFEIPACGGFQLTSKVEHLEEYFLEGKEVVSFSDEADLMEKARYYLGNEDERAAIALAGYERSLREHTYERRFRDIFARVMGGAYAPGTLGGES